MAPLDRQDLCHDRRGDLFRLLGANVQAGGSMQAGPVSIGQVNAISFELGQQL